MNVLAWISNVFYSLVIKTLGLRLTLSIPVGGDTIVVAPVGGRLVVDVAGEAVVEARLIGVGLAVEVCGNGGTEAGIVVLRDHDAPGITLSTGDSDSRGAGSESEDGSREAHDY